MVTRFVTDDDAHGIWRDRACWRDRVRDLGVLVDLHRRRPPVVHGFHELDVDRAVREPTFSECRDRRVRRVGVDLDAGNESPGEAVSPRDLIVVDLVGRRRREVHGAHAVDQLHASIMSPIFLGCGVAVLLGVLVALSFGTADFVGGRASARASVLGTLVVSQACSLVGAIALVVFIDGTFTNDDLLLGACAGAFNVVGLGLLYHSLATYPRQCRCADCGRARRARAGRVGLLPGRTSLPLVVCGIVARDRGRHADRTGARRAARVFAAGAVVAALAGVALGTSLVFFAETTSTSGMWPALSARATAAVLVWLVAIVLVLVLRKAMPAIPRNRTFGLAVAVGVLDVAATAMLVLAVRRGLIVVVAPVASLAPGFTVVLAWLLLGEHLDSVQRLGLVLAFAGIVLVSVG